MVWLVGLLACLLFGLICLLVVLFVSCSDCWFGCCFYLACLLVGLLVAYFICCLFCLVCLFCLMVSLLVGLVGWFVVLLLDVFVGMLFVFSVGLFVGLFVFLVSWLACLLFGLLLDLFVHWFVDWLACRVAYLLIWLVGLFGLFVCWLVCWLCVCLVCVVSVRGSCLFCWLLILCFFSTATARHISASTTLQSTQPRPERS